MPGDVKRVHAIGKEAQRAREQIEDGDVFLPVLGEPGENLHHVRGVAEGIEIVADGQVRVLCLRAGDHVELAPAGQHQPGATEVFEVRTEAAERTPRAFGDHTELAVLSRVERQDAVGLAEVHPAEDDGFAAIESL